MMRKYTFIALLLSLPLISIGQSMLSLAITGYNAGCYGSASGSAKVIATGGTLPYTYSWSPLSSIADSVSGLSVGIYSVTVTDSNGNTILGSVTIGQPAPLSVSIDSIVVLACFRTTSGGACGCTNKLWAVVNGGTPPYSYLWTPSGVTTDTLNGACYLEFTVSVTDSYNCLSADSINVVSPPSHIITSGVSQVSAAGQVSVYPNPASTQLNISLGQPAAVSTEAVVYDMLGRGVLMQNIGIGESLVTLDVAALAEGSYLLRMGRNDQQAVTRFSVAR